MEPAKFFNVDTLESLAEPKHFNAGLPEDWHGRLDHHNSGSVPHTAKDRPWQVKTALAFTDRDRAFDFERCLMSGSGRALAQKRL